MSPAARAVRQLRSMDIVVANEGCDDVTLMRRIDLARRFAEKVPKGRRSRCR
jgi:hypothetical protein